MRLNSLKLQNFRNYESVQLSFSKNINIFIGDNAQGKTNILESIYVLAITKSHRLFIQDNLIQDTKEFSRIEGEMSKNEKTYKLSILMNSQGKNVSINRLNIKKISDYIAKMNVIIFSPDDIELIKGSPASRRKFLNIEIGQLYHKYLFVLSQYNQLLKNRNDYLKKLKNEKLDQDYMNILTNQLVDKAMDIYTMRSDFIDKTNGFLSKIYLDIAKEGRLLLNYETTIPIDLLKESKSKFKEKMRDKLNHNLQREIILGQTMIGPHRDDFSLLIDGFDIRNYGSQGQQKVAIISLKLSEIDIFKEVKKEYPILLLDDIFSELDIGKKNNLMKYINTDIQTIITTTDIHKIEKNILKEADIFLIEKGNVTKR